MRSKIYSTKEIADLCSIHPNTVRLYENWGYISKAERGTNNYRRFTDKHLLQMRLARIALPGPYPIDSDIVQDLVKSYAAGDIRGAVKLAGEYLARVKAELRKALEAMKVLDKWFENKPGSKGNIIHETPFSKSSQGPPVFFSTRAKSLAAGSISLAPGSLTSSGASCKTLSMPGAASNVPPFPS